LNWDFWFFSRNSGFDPDLTAGMGIDLGGAMNLSYHPVGFSKEKE
jgi:hypothetical protein